MNYFQYYKKMIKNGRKKQHLHDSCLKTATGHRESRKNRQKKPELSA